MMTIKAIENAIHYIATSSTKRNKYKSNYINYVTETADKFIKKNMMNKNSIRIP